MDQVDCDRCGAGFVPEPYERRRGSGVQMQFDCHHCGETFAIATISAKGVKIRRKLKQAERAGDRQSVALLRRELAPHVRRASQSRT